MPKISELSAITEITDNDVLMITDAETSASKKITWSNVKSSINSTLTISGDSNNTGRINIQQSNDGTGGPNLILKKSRGSTSSVSLINNGDTIGKVAAYGYANDGGFDAFLLSGNFGWVADGT